MRLLEYEAHTGTSTWRSTSRPRLRNMIHPAALPREIVLDFSSREKERRRQASALCGFRTQPQTAVPQSTERASPYPHGLALRLLEALALLEEAGHLRLLAQLTCYLPRFTCFCSTTANKPAWKVAIARELHSMTNSYCSSSFGSYDKKHFGATAVFRYEGRQWHGMSFLFLHKPDIVLNTWHSESLRCMLCQEKSLDFLCKGYWHGNRRNCLKIWSLSTEGMHRHQHK